nr:siderophore-interacting protein [Pseudomonas sp.]
MTRPDLAVQKLRHPIKPRLLQVRRITQLSPSMRRITLAGPDLEGFLSASFDDHVKLFLPAEAGAKPVMPVIGSNGPEFPADMPRPVSRDYTPRSYDPVSQELDIDFVLHHSGPATDWATQASPGDYLGVAGPRGSFVIPVGFDWHLLIGDETAIPAIGRRLEELPEDTQAIVVVKLRNPADRTEFVHRCTLHVEWVVDDDAPADNEQTNSSGERPNLLEQVVRALVLPDGEGYVWAAGEYTDIQQVRAYLVNECGVDKSRIRAASYWRKAAPGTHVNF